MKTSKYDLKIVENKDFNHTAAEIIFNSIRKTLEVKDVLTLVLSGGSTPEKTFSILADDSSFRSEIPWDRIHFFWGDERHVSPESAESNYRMANQAMLSRVPVPRENIHRIESEIPDADEVAEKYERELRAFFKKEPGQLPSFDCLLLGLGTDGHTASLFPGTDALHEKNRLVVANNVEQLRTYRITLTLPVLNNADFVMFLVSGNEKADILREVIEGEGHPLPAQLIRPAHGRLLWLVDRAASHRLTHV